jgi:hypothetical protein
MEIDWIDFDNKLKNIKYSYCLIFKFFNLLEFIDDNTASIIIKYIIKNNLALFINNPFFILCKYIPLDKYKLTITVILEFYNLIKKKIKLTLYILKWQCAFPNKQFWNLEIDDQVIYLYNLKNQILSNFDCSKGGVPLKFKIISLLKVNRIFILNILVERLTNIYNLMGNKYFILAKIPIMLQSELYDLPNEHIVKYTHLIHDRITDMLDKTINYFEKFIMILSQIDNLINPLFINITTNNQNNENDNDKNNNDENNNDENDNDENNNDENDKDENNNDKNNNDENDNDKNNKDEIINEIMNEIIDDENDNDKIINEIISEIINKII